MFETLVAILSSGGAGAVVGLIGSVATRFMEYKNAKLKYAHEERMEELDNQATVALHAHEIKIAGKQIERARVEGELEVEEKEVDAFVASQRQVEPATGWAATWRTAMRPAITSYLVVLVTAFMVLIWVEVGGLGAFGEKELVEMFKFVIYQVVFLLVTSVTWWFGSRPSQEWKKGLFPKFGG